MGLFDIFRRSKKKNIKPLEETIVDEKELIAENVVDEKEILTDEKVEDQSESNESIKEEYTYSDIISNETIEKIKEINEIVYINKIMIERMEKYPELVELLLKGNIPEEILYMLNNDIVSFLPSKVDDLKYIKFLDFNEEIKEKIELLNNVINVDSINDEYISYYFNLEKEFNTQNEIESFIPNIKLNLGSELLTEPDCYSDIVLHLPKSKYKIVCYNYKEFISGKIELNEDVIIRMNYEKFCLLDKTIIDKISKCKIFLTQDTFKMNSNHSDIAHDETNYRLIKYNHLIYIVENSSLDTETRERLIYTLKNLYIEDSELFDFDLQDKVVPFLNNLDKEEIKKLTKEFELKLDIYIRKNIEKPNFNASYFIDDLDKTFIDFDNATLQEFIDYIDSLPNDLKILVLNEPRVQKKFNLPENMDENMLRKIIYVLSQRLSKTTTDFINSIDVDVESFMSSEKNNCQSTYDINPIVAKYGIFNYIDEATIISIADLVGHDAFDNSIYSKNNIKNNILHTFKYFFDEKGDGYHTRALSLLEYKTGSQLLEALEKRNNDTKDMSVRLLEDGKYVVSSNGLHRFTILRFHYLLDCMKKEKNEEELRELYKIPVNMESTTNFKKTYCNYLIQKINPEISYVYFNSSKDEITFLYKSGNQSEKMNEEKILILITQCVDSLDSSALSEITYFYKTCASFHEFVDKYVPQLLSKMKIEDKGMIQK